MNYEALIAQKDADLAQKDAKITELSARIDELSYLIAQLQKQVFGPKSERYIHNIDPGQLNIFGDNDQIDPLNSAVTSPKETITYEREKKKSAQKGRQLLASCSHLPVEEKIIEPEHDDTDIHIGDEITEKLAKQPGKLYIKRIIRRKYKKAGQDVIITPPLEEEAIPKCEADVSLLADVVVSKFVDHIPEYRQQQIYKRQGVVIPPSTMNGWVHQLSPYMKLMSEYIKAQILQSKYIQQDESTIKVMDGKKQATHTGYMWVMGSTELKYVCFEYHKGRGREGPINNLKQFKGFLQTDAYEVYEVIDKMYNDVEHFNCWAHGRRKFIESINNDKARSEYALNQIQKLYAIEQKCRDASSTHDDRTKERQAAKPILNQFKQWLDAEALKVTPRSPIGKAMAYLIARWDKFTKYTDYGMVEIDNNIIENAIRPLALGRKNYLFAGNHDAATNIGYYYTIFSTCKAHGVNPYDYIVWFLSLVPSAKTSEIGTLSPDAYLTSLNQTT
jgi:transposase